MGHLICYLQKFRHVGSIFQCNSPYGRFARSVTPLKRRGRFPKRLRDVIDRMRSSCGSSSHRTHRRTVCRFMRKFNRQRWAVCRNVHRLVRDDLKPKSAASYLITVGDEILDDATAEHIWIEFGRSQTSWDGQIPPEQILDLYQGWSIEPPCMPPMPEEAKQLHHCTKHWLKAVSESPLVSRSRALVQWSELCDAIACINLRTAPPPTEPIPVLILCLPSSSAGLLRWFPSSF